MKNERLIAYVLIAVGVVALLSRLGSADWLWIALVAAALLAGYVTRKNYGFLVAGSICAGLSVGTLIGTPSGVLISLGAGLLAVDRVEPRPNRWPLYLAGVLAGVGLLYGVGNIFDSFWTALIFIAGGAYLLLREKDEVSGAPTPSEQPGQDVSARDVSGQDTSAGATGQAEVGEGQGSVSTAKAPPQSAASAASSPKEAAAQKTERPAEGNAPALDEPGLNADERERYHLLETWRRETSRSESRPAYIILRNESLTQIAQRNPQTLDELSKVKGIGPVKLEQYGETILRVLRGERPADEAS